MVYGVEEFTGRNARPPYKTTVRSGPYVPEGSTMQRSSSQVRPLDPQQACECLSDQPRLFAVGGCRGLPIVLQAAALVMVGVQQIAAWVPVLLDTLAVRYRANPATARSVAAKSRKLLRYLISAGTAHGAR